MSQLKGFMFMWIIATTIKVSSGLQRFAEQPKYTEVNPGQDTLLKCKIIDKRGTCSWQKDNKPVGIYPKKYEWDGDSMRTSHIGGDCSLWIRSATLEFDDGQWECQVTSSDFTTQDALTSHPVRLVVRVAPQRPRLEFEGMHILPGQNVTVDSKGTAVVKCVSHYGNPPASLRWFLGDREYPPLHPQTNATEADNPRTWSAASVVQIPTTRERHGEVLKCVAIHESYSAKSVAVEAKMDVKYPPTIRLLGAPQIDLEEGKDSLLIQCVADANPPASIIWRRSGRSEIASVQSVLQIQSVGRRDAGLYTCQAQNSVGTSPLLSVQLDVKYPPKILSAGPDRLTTAPLFSPAAFECLGEGNPPPVYKWVQKTASGSTYVERGRESRLVIDNVTYEYQGEYECRATNIINGQERIVSSDPVSLQVVGAPLVLRLYPGTHIVSVHKGESANLSLVVCADPRPRYVAWQWGSIKLEPGSGFERYRFDEVTQDPREDCYLATLHILNADSHDSRPYNLIVENDRGSDRHSIHLNVEDPLEMSYVLGIAVGCLAALLIFICLCIYAVRTRKCCFKSRRAFKSTKNDSEKRDLKSRSDSTNGPQLDSIYTTPAGFHHHSQRSPEAMKSTTQNGLPNTINTGNNNNNNNNNNIINNASADLVLVGQQRHHRDLFTGSLGIPDVTTHVGSVIHAFESMAQNRNNFVETGEKPYEMFGSVANKTFKSPNINSSSQRKSNTSSCSSSNIPKKQSENMQKIMLEKFDQQQQQQHQHHQEQQQRHTIPQYHHQHNPHSSKQNHSFNMQPSESRGIVATLQQQQQRHKSTIGDGYVKTGEIFYHPEIENESSNLDSINVDDYRKNLFGNHPNVTNIDGRIFHSQVNGNYDVVNFIDLNRKKTQRPLSTIETKLRKINSKNPEVFYGPSIPKRPSYDFIQSHSNNYNEDDDHYNDNFNFNNDYDDDPTFLRGSTVSQSFIKNVKNHKNNPISSTSSTSNGFRHDKIFNSSSNSKHSKSHKRHKSVNELSDELKTRYNYNENFDARNSTKRQSFKPRTIDRAVI